MLIANRAQIPAPNPVARLTFLLGKSLAIHRLLPVYPGETICVDKHAPAHRENRGI